MDMQVRGVGPSRQYRRDPPAQHRFTTTSYDYSGRRNAQPTLGGSCCGAVFGLALLLGATALLWTNEASAVRAQESVLDALDALAKLEAGDASGGRGLTHVSGALRVERPLEDGDFGIRSEAIELQRVVEVFQWHEKTRTQKQNKGHVHSETTVVTEYHPDWSSHEIASSSFAHPYGHTNPSVQTATGEATRCRHEGVA